MTATLDFSNVRILCVGDLIIDRFVNGTVGRISPESPVPVLSIGETLSVPGGAANVARNISALGGYCKLIGLIGDDRAGRDLIEALAICENIALSPITESGRPTSEKIRYVAQGQQLLRTDHERAMAIGDEAAAQLIRNVENEIAHHDILVLSDYAKGVLAPFVLRRLIELAQAHGVPVIVDPKSSDLARYSGASVITPNIAETRIAIGIEVVTDEDAERAGWQIMKLASTTAVLLMRSEKGMSLVSGTGSTHIRTCAREVFDVSGAGDTVVATLSLALASQIPLEEAASIANVAAGVVVAKRGTATVSLFELLEEMELIARRNLEIPSAKVMTRSAARGHRDAWEAAGLTVGFTNGCFDILHLGHVRLLEFARSQCDQLIVAINSDASVSRLKGPDRPVNGEMERALILSALAFVDQVVIFDEDTPQNLIDALLPDVLVKGADYKIEDIVGAETVTARGGKVVTFELVPGRSTTATIDRMKSVAGRPN